MTASETDDFKRAARLLYILAVGLIMAFGAVNLAGFIWNRTTIEQLDRRLDTCEQRTR